ncbi:MAG: VWA domain-containing protein [Candidatus Thiodiazotropha sp. (ex Lucinoma aequizonata)]|nr:VWA domain-containing protein [Candidatus Thiodiazotropha sp. (ex Lucinoma aequizonata)]MCU7887862.1 VWA domain-containing protein [Candidatus Thiodiazotropha sp. (ex Lucinoma aequizonata)]MCU7895393.1 VWA domain-containing protein [Candidatus Thiodiazotropha sp. (ex Lucinoma aequizonata)]MCU7900406.1 VWA domain-containing protein [Candidatus Thiodiazotropha sp. (ex Lucinoma aequizonata)]MCU7901968.1 VWA domain-containing protein [Candidatus Thiodiazotropha sp. (ex Lucinoma aequizonata)]
MATLKSVFISLIILFFVPSLLASTPQQPLLMKGKQALYQRVLSKPGAYFFQEVEQGKSKPATPFSVYYVYSRTVKNGSSWLQLGQNRHGGLAGWMPEIDTILWNQGLTVAFRDPLGSDRVLLFNEKANLKKLITDNDEALYKQLYQAAEAKKLDADSPVIAIQPRTHVDILKDFYLIPIRDHEDIYIGSEQARMLQVSSVPLLPYQLPIEKSKTKATAENTSIKPFRSAIVFVIDSTLSMDPYIDRTREAVRKIYDTITKEDLTGDVSFGLIAFRDNPQAVPDLNYLTHTYVNLHQGQDAEGFFNQVTSLKAATVSSRDFSEDSYAGVNEAIAGINWEGQDARYVVLVTDAGPREAGDPLSGTGMSSTALRRLAQNKGIALSVLHLLTPSIMADHTKAEAAYRDLSYYPGIGSLYFGVETGNVERFGRVLDALAQQITEQVKLAAMATVGKSMAEEPQAREKQVVQPEEPDQLALFQAKVAKLGYALRMRYLQQKDKEQIPSIFSAWLVDRDISNPQRQTLDVRVLLSRDQLSDLHSIMRQVLITAEEGLLSPRNFLNDLKSLAATIARDPEQLGTTTRVTGAREGNLADMGFMREYIEDLPYTGEVMSLSLDSWQDWPARDQISFINRLEEKINYYQALHDHTDLWVSLDGGPVSGDSVFPIALEMLP